MVTVGQGDEMIALQVGKVEVDAPFIEQVLSKLLERFAPDTAVVMSFRQASFRTRPRPRGLCRAVRISSCARVRWSSEWQPHASRRRGQDR